MNTFQTFTDKIKKGLEEYLGEGYCVVTVNVRKNNGVVYQGVSIKNKNSNIAPSIYLERFYRDYKEGTPLGEVLKKVIFTYEQCKTDEKIDVDIFDDYNGIKERIVCRLIHFESNRELLEEVPYVRFLDMAVVFYCTVCHDVLGDLSILIKKDMCIRWNVREQELIGPAIENSMRIFPPVTEDIRKILGSTEGSSNREKEKNIPFMYVLTNTRKLYGAVCMIYPNVLEDFAERMGCSIYILPSSIHEVLLVGTNTNRHDNAEELSAMVREINETHVEREEVLSNHAYFYDLEKRIFLSV